MASTPDDSSLSSDQDTNQFWCKRGLNPRSLIQPSETLPEFDCTVTCNLQLFLNLLHHDSDYGIWMIIKSSQFYNSHAPLCI